MAWVIVPYRNRYRGSDRFALLRINQPFKVTHEFTKLLGNFVE